MNAVWHFRAVFPGGSPPSACAWRRAGVVAEPPTSSAPVIEPHCKADFAGGDRSFINRPDASWSHSSGIPALIRASRKPGAASIKAGRCASNHATESLGFNVIACASAAFASGALSAAA